MSFRGDLADSIRTIQYGIPPLEEVGADGPVHFTTLVFLQDSVFHDIENPLYNGGIEPVFLDGDGFDVNCAVVGPSEYQLLSVPVPEPGTSLLIGLGLAGLAASRRATPRSGLR